MTWVCGRGGRACSTSKQKLAPRFLMRFSSAPFYRETEAQGWGETHKRDKRLGTQRLIPRSWKGNGRSGQERRRKDGVRRHLCL